MISEKIKQRIKFSSIITIIVLAIAFAIFTVIKYQVEGEKNIPFKIGKIIVISSATTNENQATENTSEEKFLWEENVVQTNDLYIYIDKNKDYNKNEVIKNVTIENIKILQTAKIGKIQVYMPNSLDDGTYKYINDYLVNSTLTYKGSQQNNRKNLEIGNQGGEVCISFANVGLDVYKSNDDLEIKQGAEILQKMGINEEDLKFKVSFDLIIEVSDKSYKTNLTLDLPIEGLIGNEQSNKEFTDFSSLIYRRK